MITIDQYVGVHKDSPDWTPERKTNAFKLLQHVSLLQSKLIERGVVFNINPKTKSEISGNVFGGFRPQSCGQGSPHSSHKEALGVDIYDPHNVIDSALKDDYDKCVAEGREDDSLLVQCDIYLEHPNSTDTWSHWSVRRPGSGRRIFLP